MKRGSVTSDAYSAVHHRLAKTNGPASNHVCVDCGGAASRWSWNRTGPQITGANQGKTVSWGTSLSDYSARCASCSTRMDRGGSVTHCPRGHDRALHGKNSNGTCRECARENTRRRRARA